MYFIDILMTFINFLLFGVFLYLFVVLNFQKKKKMIIETYIYYKTSSTSVIWWGYELHASLP